MTATATAAPIDLAETRVGRRSGAWYLVAGMASAQLGATIASDLFDEVAPPVVVFFRQLITGAVLYAISRPSLRSLTRQQIAAIASFGVVMAAMSLMFYEGVARLPLALAVTIELTGPLALGLLLSRRRADAMLGLAAAGGVLLIRSASLTGGGAGTTGLLFALGAGACWAAYILLNRRLGSQFDGFDGLALGMLAASVISFPFALAGGIGPALVPDRFARIAAVALLSGLMCFSFEFLGLRRLSARIAAVLYSLSPAIAAVVAWIALDQPLSPTELAGIAVIVSVSALAVRSDEAQPRSETT